MLTTTSAADVAGMTDVADVAGMTNAADMTDATKSEPLEKPSSFPRKRESSA
ncbi:MAG: hypothetical protein LBI87_09160 [Candidatus Accumulibacter sp.]|jgi:hypothetical protein|nr:hypothetical protein [Accumulibacter sp.]